MDLLEAARRGRQDAFVQLFDEHHASLFRFAYRMTGSAADAEDIVQECFLELLRPECRYNPRRSSLRTYLFGVVRNQSLKRLRRNEQKIANHQDDISSPETEALRTELQDAVARAIVRLPETQREVLLLAQYERMPLAEIARAMSLDLGAVKSRLQRARASLKTMLAAYTPDLEKKR
jgi:RNA polymerase sigma-70 factor (ECF subfamily)